MLELNKEYWADRWAKGETGWDLGSVSPPIKEYADSLKDKNIKILIPGAGNAYEAQYLFHAGFKNVFVLDIASAPLTALQKQIPEFPKMHLIEKDFFEMNESFDLIIEQTFFCALNPSLRKEYVLKMHDLLTEKGKLAGLLFDDDLNSDKPPFGGHKEEYLRLFENKFTIHRMDIASNSVGPRQGRELFFELEKK